VHARRCKASAISGTSSSQVKSSGMFGCLNDINNDIRFVRGICKYISDGIGGSDEDMTVHKFAEEALYKYIAYAILSTRANTPEYLVSRFKKERSAAKRNAKLRLSNIKIEEITQVMRNKSKIIKH